MTENFLIKSYFANKKYHNNYINIGKIKTLKTIFDYNYKCLKPTPPQCASQENRFKIKLIINVLDMNIALYDVELKKVIFNKLEKNDLRDEKSSLNEHKIYWINCFVDNMIREKYPNYTIM